MRYDGTKDPQEHLAAFEARMNLEVVGDAVQCRAFPITMVGPAIWWFNALLQESITALADISCSFLAQFTTRIAKAKHPINLLGINQKAVEPTRKFLDRFNDECLEIDGLTDSVEIQNVAREYINDEEVSQVVATNKQQSTNLPRRQPVYADKPREIPKEGASEKQSKPFSWLGKFTNYTHLMAPIVEVYQQIADKGILSKPRQLNDGTGGNKSLYCDYHEGFSHKTRTVLT
ncbi:uncharacterized protein LOC107611102 [Arachis ipaensis]|uniref:uncharacterized protein LOC107611102 n=1 Tax=Arachis ipaensis TaxID=130454 RepID=UPI0007AF88A0|nr:uncharacterized protein LOC107611102 [Arachis ipaensis]XP_025670297.1 uncharacterized protein LOC112770093 [Arachis hypogaea]